MQDFAYKIRTPKLKKSKVTRLLSYLKYILLVVLVIAVPLAFVGQDRLIPAFCKFVCPAGTFGGAISLLFHPDNADLYGMLGPMFTWKFALFCAIAVACVFIYRAFCRFICPLGAIYGFFNKIALLGIKLDKEKCTDCGLCVAHCKMDIKRVGDHECINCGECISVCPTKAIRWKGSQFFVRENEIETAQPSKAPLAQMVRPAAATEAAAEVNTSLSQTAIGATPENVQTAQPVTIAHGESTQAAPRPLIGAKGKKVFKAVVYTLAALLLAGALLYYNFFDEEVVAPPPDTGSEYGSEVGDMCYDFTVQVYDKAGRLSEMIGRNVGDEQLVMDVRLKKQYSIGWIANAEAAGGTEERYLARLFALRFTNHSRLSFFGAVNNVNEYVKPGEGSEWTPSVGNGLTTTRHAGADYLISDRNKRFKLQGNAEVRHSDDAYDQRSTSVNFLGGGDTYGRSSYRNRTHNVSLGSYHTWDFNWEKAKLTVQPSLTYLKTRQTEGQLSGTFASDPGEYMGSEVLDSLFRPGLDSRVLAATLNRYRSDQRYSGHSVTTGLYANSMMDIPHSGDHLQIEASGNYGDNTDVPLWNGLARSLNTIAARVGDMVGASNEGHTFRAVVKEITDKEITLDFNHPLAGKDLTFEVEIKEIN